MRLWHYDLIKDLPRQQLVSQWREILAIKGAIIKNGTPNHRLVNKIMYYSIDCFKSYSGSVINEMRNRGYKPNEQKVDELFRWDCDLFGKKYWQEFKTEWHNDRYLKQCYYNLQEKYDCEIITDEEWELLKSKFYEI